MAAAETARLIAELELRDKNFSKNVNNAMSSLGKLGVKSTAIGTAIGVSIAGIGARLASAGASAFPKIINAASDLNETVSKVGVVFGAQAPKVLAFGETAAQALGLSQNAALSAAGQYGNLFVSMGLAADKSADMSINLVELAGDLASFNNIDPTEALEKLRAGLTGESEPLKTLGININEAILKQKAFSLGLTKDTKTVLPAAIKAQAAYALIFEQSATAQGDFARTSGGLANQQRILRANLENTAATLGTALLPKIAELVKRINELVTGNKANIAKFAEQLPKAFDKAMEFAKQIPWGAIADGLKTGAFFAGKLVEVFVSMPPQVQATIIALAGLNKLSGGAIGGIVSELGKGLIKGVLGMTAGVVNLKAAAVTGLGGGVPGVLPAATGLNAIQKVAIFGAVSIAAGSLFALAEIFTSQQAEFKQQTDQAASDLANQIQSGAKTKDLLKSQAALKQGIDDLTEISKTLPFGTLAVSGPLADLTKQLAEVEAELKRREAGGAPLTLGGTGGMSPDERAEHQAARDAWIALREKVGEIGKGSPVTTLKESKVGVDAVALADAMTTTVLKGWGTYFDSFEHQKGLLASIEASQKTFLAQGDTVTAAALEADIEALRAFMAGNSRDAEILMAAHEIKSEIDAGSTTATVIAAAQARTAMENAAALKAAITKTGTDAQIVAAANARTAAEKASALKSSIDRAATDDRIKAAAAARAAMEQRAATLGVRDAIDRKKLALTTNVTVNTAVSATMVQDTIKKVNTWQSTNTINTLGYGVE